MLLFSAFACPLLSGSYTCFTKDSVQSLTVQQQITATGTLFKFQSDSHTPYQLHADGKLYKTTKDIIHNDTKRVVGTVTTEGLIRCQNQFLQSSIIEKALYYDLGRMVFETDISFEKQRLGLQYKEINTFTDIDGLKQKEVQSYFCKK